MHTNTITTQIQLQYKYNFKDNTHTNTITIQIHLEIQYTYQYNYNCKDNTHTNTSTSTIAKTTTIAKTGSSDTMHDVSGPPLCCLETSCPIHDVTWNHIPDERRPETVLPFCVKILSHKLVVVSQVFQDMTPSHLGNSLPMFQAAYCPPLQGLCSPSLNWCHKLLCNIAN
jgi:hypothetical protein